MAKNQTQKQNSSQKNLNDEKITETSQSGTGDISNQRNQAFNKDKNLGGNDSGRTKFTSR